jgi:hypothetical protein
MFVTTDLSMPSNTKPSMLFIKIAVKMLTADVSIKYKVEINTQHFKTSVVNFSELERFIYREAVFEFKFKDVDVVPLRRYQPFTVSEFLAQSGGMMGLFAGISALSIIELFYFLTLRLFVNFWRWFKQ